MLFGLTGCLQSDTVISIKPDGSGTLKETFLMNKMFVQQMQAMMQQMVGEMGEPEQGAPAKAGEKSFDLFDEAKLRAKASELGEGVSYISGKKVTTETLEGYQAVYAFKDINKLKLNQNPGDNVPSAPGEQKSASDKKKEFIEFRFTKGAPSSLIIKMPSAKTDPAENKVQEETEKPKPDEQQEKQMMEQMRMMFQDMKIAMSIDVQGSLVETNATHVEGSRITLMEMDFGKLLAMPEKFKEFSMAQPETLEETKKFMEMIPGIKVDRGKNQETRSPWEYSRRFRTNP
jgi:hypothetical protein